MTKWVATFTDGATVALVAVSMGQAAKMITRKYPKKRVKSVRRKTKRNRKKTKKSKRTKKRNKKRRTRKRRYLMVKKKRRPITGLFSRRAIFSRVQNEKYWKRPTKRVVVKKRAEAERIGKAIAFYVGGYEIRKTKRGYSVGSKGYYHYIGA